MNRRIVLQITLVLLIAGIAVGCGSAGIVTGSQTDDEEFMLDGPPNHEQQVPPCAPGGYGPTFYAMPPGEQGYSVEGDAYVL